jgi:iron complex transport system ATP-binding protein
MSALLRFIDLEFSYPHRTVFNGLDAALPSDACIALVGPNGSGKTTLLRLAAGSLKPDRGDVRLHGESIGALSQRTIARSIALVPQNVEVSFPFTVQQFVEQGRTPYLKMFGGLSAPDRDAVEHAMVLTDTYSLRARVFNELSGGERQRVKIALGLAQQPSLLLLDEPTQHLDIGRQLELTDLIKRLHRHGIAILASMHELTLIEDTFSSVWLLAPDEEMLQGTPREMLRPELLGRVFDCPPYSGPVLLKPAPKKSERVRV